MPALLLALLKFGRIDWMIGEGGGGGGMGLWRIGFTASARLEFGREFSLFF